MSPSGNHSNYDYRRSQDYCSCDCEKNWNLNNISQAVEGSEIDGLSDEELKTYVEDKRVYARVSPEHKIRIVRAWQRKG